MKLQVYVAARTVGGIGCALAAVFSIILLVDTVELSRALGGRADISFVRILELSLLKAPSVILILLPFAVLFGAMGAFVTLNRRAELIAMRTAGLSAWGFILPAALAAGLVGVVGVVGLNPLASGLNARFVELRTRLVSGGGAASPGEVWLREGDGATETVIHAKASNTRRGGPTRLEGVSIYIQGGGRPGAIGLARRIEADSAVLTPGYWRLTRAREARAGSEQVRSESLLLPSTLDHPADLEGFASPGAVAVWDLPATIRAADQAGYSSAAYRIRLQQQLALPADAGGHDDPGGAPSPCACRVWATWPDWRALGFR